MIYSPFLSLQGGLGGIRTSGFQGFVRRTLHTLQNQPSICFVDSNNTHLHLFFYCSVNFSVQAFLASFQSGILIRALCQGGTRKFRMLPQIAPDLQFPASSLHLIGLFFLFLPSTDSQWQDVSYAITAEKYSQISFSCVRVFLEITAKRVDTATAPFNTLPLHAAAANGDIDMVSLILSGEVDVSRIDDLHLTASQGHAEVAKAIMVKQ